MNLAQIASAVLRRWYVAVLVLALTAYGAAAAWQSARPIYTSSTTMTVVPSSSFMQARADTGTGESSLGNPFGFTAAPTLTALLSDAINYGAVDLPPEAAGASLSVAADNQSRGSAFFTVNAVGRSPEAVIAALTALDTQAPAALVAIQQGAGAPSDQVFTALRTRGIPYPAEDFPDRQRAALGIVLVGLLATALLCVAVDSLVARRRDRLATAGATEEGEDELEPSARVRTSRRWRSSKREELTDDSRSERADDFAEDAPSRR